MKYIASFSGGKDSVATIILAHEHSEPLDEIIFSEVMFDENTSGELPEHIDFVKNICIPIFDEWGYKTTILHAKKTYIDCFYSVISRSKCPERIGKYYGFPMARHCIINDRIKIQAIRDFFKNEDIANVTQYLGIAADELPRLKRIENTNKISLLAKYGYTEKMAFDLCKKYGLLSPLYAFAKRGGCWFCPNASDRELRHLRDTHPELWEKLLELENEPNKVGYIFNILTKTSIHQKEQNFAFDDAQMATWDFL